MTEYGPNGWYQSFACESGDHAGCRESLCRCDHHIDLGRTR